MTNYTESPPITFNNLIYEKKGLVRLPQHMEFVTYEWIEELYKAVKPHLKQRRQGGISEGAQSIK